MNPSKLIGPFKQMVTAMDPHGRGPMRDEHFQVVENAGLWVQEGLIKEIGSYRDLRSKYPHAEMEAINEDKNWVAFPGMIDCHTHLCFAGSRAHEYALRVQGQSYEAILQAGGGIHQSVRATRSSSLEDLTQLASQRILRLQNQGITTIEIKSGYGLNKEDEIKMLEAVHGAQKQVEAKLIPTFLGAHVCPKEFDDLRVYLQFLLEEVLPFVKEKALSNRVDIFVEPSAFPVDLAEPYLRQAKTMGFDLCVHADQFSSGGSDLGLAVGAKSVDHLESIALKSIAKFAEAETVAVALPGASLGLGMAFTPARKLLDAHACLAIASDWNPGSAPMGDLLVQAALLGAYEKLSMAETWLGITSRAAKALGLSGRGQLIPGKVADIIAFPTHDWKEVLYQQGYFKPSTVWISGKVVKDGY